ncbi:hypothetical protein FHG87_023095 [Trinorchestia longiramus]|nr:hypothetical protein FHG87_023095 [Trinorchestia longiramus]
MLVTLLQAHTSACVDTEVKKLVFLTRQLELLLQKQFSMNNYCFALQSYPKCNYEQLGDFLMLPCKRKLQYITSSIDKDQGSVGASRTWGRPVQSRLTKNKWRYDDVTHAEDEEDPSKQSAVFVDGAAPPLFVRAGFSHANAIITKQRNRLNLENRGDLRLKLTNFKPNINSLAAAHQAHPSH